MVAPHFRMLWSETIPKIKLTDSAGHAIAIELTAGQIGDVQAPAPTPNSWAADPANEVAIYTIQLAPHAEWTLPLAAAETNRSLYFYAGDQLSVAGTNIPLDSCVDLNADQQTIIKNGAQASSLLLLQGRPINEPVVQHGPFVMNSQAEIMEAMQDYHRTQFGGWPWENAAPVHAREQGRFARHIDGTVENRK